MIIIWDEPKRLRNIEIHRLDFEDARDHFDFRSARIQETYPATDGRARFTAIGPLGGKLVTIVFSLVGTEALSIISLREASKKERKRYG
jgi:hypothetical protein